MRAFAADDLFGGGDPGAVDERVQMAKGAEREIDRSLGVGFAGDVGEREAGGGPSSAAKASPAVRLVSAMTTEPPSLTSSRAVAAPSPDAPPVTRKT
jgi:hypothetical protein